MSDFLNELSYAGSPYQGKANLTKMSPDFMTSFDQMAQEYYSQTGKELKVNDAWRSTEAQAQAYKNKPHLAAKPGHSLHEKGMAMDLDTDQANQLAEMGLLGKYGFERPMLGKGKSGKNEPWHIQLRNLEKEAGTRAAEVKPDFMKELNSVGDFSQELGAIGQVQMPAMTPGALSQAQRQPQNLNAATQPVAPPGGVGRPTHDTGASLLGLTGSMVADPLEAVAAIPGAVVNALTPGGPSSQPNPNAMQAGMKSVTGAATGAIDKAEQPLPKQPEQPSIGALLHKVFLGDGKRSIQEGIERYFSSPQGVENLNQDFAKAMQSPEMAAWGALDPMMGLVSPAAKGAGLVAKAAPKSKELGALEKVVGLEKFNPAEMQALADKAKDFGITLTVPELTNSPTLRGLWTRLAKTPGPEAEKIATYLEEIRKPQVEEAISRELGNVAPVSVTPVQAGGMARAAAQNVEERIKTTRKTATQPLYKAAFEDAKPVDTTEIVGKLSQQIDKYPEGHPSRAALQQVERMLTKDAEANAQTIVAQGGIAGPVETKRLPVTDLETLHNTKTGIDQLLEKAKADKSIDNDTRRLLMRTKSQLQGRMEADNPLYGQAQKTFRLLSKPLNDFRFGNPNIAPRDPHVSTVIKQLADLPETNLEKAVDIVFAGNKPQQIAKTKSYFDKAYPGTWDAMVRTKLEQQLNKIRDTVIEREGNVGGIFKRTVFKNAQDRNMWQAAMGPEKFKRFEGFMEVLDKTRRIIYTNSETAFQIEAGKILEKGGLEDVISRVPTSTGGVIKWLVSRFDRLQRPQFAAQLTDAMLDPQNAIELTRLRRMPDTPKKAFATAQFLDNAVFKVSPEKVKKD